MGYDSSMMNGLNILPQYSEYFHLKTATKGLNTAAIWVGSLLGCFLIQPIPDFLGRKKAIFVSAVICLVGCVIQSASQNIAMFVIGRIIVGFGAQLSSGACPVLLSEIVPATRRGTILGLFFSFFYVGSLVSSGINYRMVEIASTWSWRIPSIIQCVPSLLALLLLAFVPESPRWLVSKDRPDDALEVLAIINGKTSVEDMNVVATFDEITSVLAAEKEQYPRSPWIELVSTKANRMRLAIVIVFGVMIETLGNYVASYVDIHLFFFFFFFLSRANLKTDTMLEICSMRQE